MQAVAAALPDRDQLGARLRKAIGPLRVRQAIVGLSTDTITLTAAAGSEVAPEAANSGGFEFPIRIGCLIKLLTATLALDAVAAGLIDLEAPLLEYLPELRGRCANADAVRIRHLLEHTHGIDDSLLPVDRPSGSQRIDLERIGSSLAELPALNLPGQLYSYSHLGALLLGAILEKRLGESYSEILNARLLARAGIALPSEASQRGHGEFSLSPSFEGELSLSATQMLRLFGQCARGSLRWQTRTITELPGWSPVERGICLGWKAYGDDWFGHASDLREHLTIVKVQPDSGTVLLVSSADYAPSAIMSAVFADLLPRSHQLRLPRLLSAQERAALNFAPYLNEYGNAALTVSLSRADSEALTINVVHHPGRVDGGARDVATTALPARDNLFVCKGVAGDFAVFQLLGPDGMGFRHLWNGKTILRRTGAD